MARLSDVGEREAIPDFEQLAEKLGATLSVSRPLDGRARSWSELHAVRGRRRVARARSVGSRGRAVEAHTRAPYERVERLAMLALGALRAAAEAGTLDDPEVIVQRTPLELDERGVEDVNEVLASTAERLNRINAESADRRRGTEGVSTELALLHFERSS